MRRCHIENRLGETGNFLPKKETHYADRDFRPFLRLRAKTLLPPTEDILERKPCLFFIFLLLGWYVRFIISPKLAGESTKKS